MTAITIAQLAKRNKREATARTRAALKESAIARLAALPASDASLTDRVQNLLAFSRPNVMDPAQMEAPARLHPVDAAAADLQAEAGSDFDGRMGRAAELVKAGIIDFTAYETTYYPHGGTGHYECKCQDARFRNRRWIMGVACKHSLALEISRRLTQEAQDTAHRKLSDRLEMSRR